MSFYLEHMDFFGCLAPNLSGQNFKQMEQIMAASEDFYKPFKSKASSPKILFLSLKNYSSHIISESILAHGLTLRGADCHFTICNGSIPKCDVKSCYDYSQELCQFCRRFSKKHLESFGVDYSLTSDYIFQEKG